MAVTEGHEETVVLRNYRKNGEPFWNRVHVRLPLFTAVVSSSSSSSLT
jgi:hypothetical protein